MLSTLFTQRHSGSPSAQSLPSFRSCTLWQMSQICVTFDLAWTTVGSANSKVCKRCLGGPVVCFARGPVVPYQRLWRRVNSQLCFRQPVTTSCSWCLLGTHSSSFSSVVSSCNFSDCLSLCSQTHSGHICWETNSCSPADPSLLQLKPYPSSLPGWLPSCTNWFDQWTLLSLVVQILTQPFVTSLSCISQCF